MEDIQTLTREKVKLDEPGLYDVIFLNDNITTTEFVVRVLKQIFGKSQEQAEAIMQKIHNSGSGIPRSLAVAFGRLIPHPQFLHTG